MTAKSRMYISIGFNIISGSSKGYSDLRWAIQKRHCGSRCLGGGWRYGDCFVKKNLQTKYFGDATEKQILVKGMVEAGEIRKEDAWDVLEEMTNMRTGNFMMFLKEIQEALHCQVIRGTLVERNVLSLNSKNEWNNKIVDVWWPGPDLILQSSFKNTNCDR